MVAAGLEAAKPFIKALCDAQTELAAKFPKPIAEFPIFVDYSDDVYAAVAESATVELSEVMSIADKHDARAGRRYPQEHDLSSVWRRSSRAARRRSPAHTAPSPRSWFGSGS